MSPLPVQPAWRLADGPEQQRWLVDGLWSEQAVGIIGGEPKCGKSFLALDLAVAVAAGIPCLRRFAVSHPGRVLLYPAEDALHIVRRRLEGICVAAGVGLAELDVQVITAPSLRLDLEADRARLEETVARLKPRLLVLDPFVRLHRIDENASGDVAPLLAFLRELQRRHAIAVVLVHHANYSLRVFSPAKPGGTQTVYRRCGVATSVRRLSNITVRNASFLHSAGVRNHGAAWRHHNPSARMADVSRSGVD